MNSSAVSNEVFPSSADASRKLAAEIAELIRRRDADGRTAVLGLATGGTPLPLYAELIRLHREEGLSFTNVVTFNLDEYLGLPDGHPESYRSFMRENLFGKIDIDPANTHLPSGQIAEHAIPEHCAEYEERIRAAGGIDFQILGIGRTGHIGFNEPGSPIDSVTRRIALDPVTRQDAAPAFDGLDAVPTHAITMGCGTILSAHRIVLMAWGAKKASIVKRAIEGPVDDQVSASFLQTHGAARFFLDLDAAAGLG